MSHAHDSRILILDFGSQYSPLIARRIRELKVYCELWSPEVSAEQIKAFAPQGIILSGGPQSVTDAETLRAPSIVFELGCPVLGICYGMQTIAAQLGGSVQSTHQPEFGYAELEVTQKNPLFSECADRQQNGAAILDVWMSHGDQVDILPTGFVQIARTARCEIAAIADLERNFYAVQFHPEVTHTPQGIHLLANFVNKICHCQPTWTTESIVEESVQYWHEKIKNDHVIIGISGGVDSAVAAALLQRAIGKQLTGIFVDTGLLRHQESHEVTEVLTKKLGMHVIRVDASVRFFEALKNVEDPEQKRKIIGEQFIRVFEAEAQKIPNVRWLAQGTIYPDVIESAQTSTKKAHVIKSHHNVGGLPEKMQLKLVEPLRELFKDEVRELGLWLGLPKTWVNRHPFPGPGLAVRIIGAVDQRNVEILQRVDAIFIQALRDHQLYEKVSQAFAVFLPIKSVGVKGDARHHGEVIALRAVTTIDFMTAEWAHLPYEFLGEVSRAIINQVPEVSRVVYDISSKPPATIEWE